jgi:hypothetical protein
MSTRRKQWIKTEDQERRAGAVAAHIRLLAEVVVAPAGLVEDGVGAPVGVHVHGAVRGGEDHPANALAGGGVDHVPCALHGHGHQLLQFIRIADRAT